jgi:hypothetical protein
MNQHVTARNTLMQVTELLMQMKNVKPKPTVG